MIEAIEYTREETKRTTRIPAGECPIKFAQFWDLGNDCLPPDTIVCSWFWAVREYGLRRGDFLTGEAIAYWLRDEIDVFSPVYGELMQVIYEYANAIGDYKAPVMEDSVA